MPNNKVNLTKAKDFITKHKKGLIITLGIIVGAFVVLGIIGAIKNSIEENRDYYIAIDDEFTFDCNAHYNEENKTIYCDEQTISGTFSNFDITELYWVEKIEGNNFTYKVKGSIYKSEYEKENFNIDDFNSEIKRNVTIYLKNNYLKKDVLKKEITIHYHLSEADKALIEQKHNDWKAWKEAEDAKSKAESEAKEQEQKQETKTEASTTTTEEHSYLDALRKCTVMEAADIYTTGIGQKSDNAFNDARATCDSWYSDWGEDDFFDAVYTDWKNRKTEQVDGKPLTHYLDILGW